MDIEAKMIGKLPGPGDWKVSIMNGVVVIASPHVGIFAVQDGALRKLPPDWDGTSPGKLVPPPR